MSMIGHFFTDVPRTDEERIQTRMELLSELHGRPYYMTVKCDGASMTVAMEGRRPSVASRNYQLADDGMSAYWDAAHTDGLLDLAKKYPHLAFQGELVGPGIQGNKLEYRLHHCLIFSIYHRNDSRYLSLKEMRILQDDNPNEYISGLPEWGYHQVPLLREGDMFTDDQESLLKIAEGKYVGTDNEREGIVVRSNDDGPRVSFKVISNKFLLDGGE